MEILLIIVVIIGFVALGYLITKKKDDSNLMDVIRMLQSGSSQNSQMFADLKQSIGEMSEIGRGMRDLQEFLKSPKLRGNMGEHVLKELLSQMMPSGAFHLQYAFRSGEKVDAAIKTGGGIIPIDSKFPMENFRKMNSSKVDAERETATKMFEKDVKGHVDSIARKYIVPDEGTIDYALMYIPSEAVYYEIVNNPTLFEYAGDKRVLPVSPTTFYAYMRAILMSLEGHKVEAKAKEILSSIKGIQKEYERANESLGTLQRHLTNASNMMGMVLNSFGNLGQKINNTRQIGEETKKELKEDA